MNYRAQARAVCGIGASFILPALLGGDESSDLECVFDISTMKKRIEIRENYHAFWVCSRGGFQIPKRFQGMVVKTLQNEIPWLSESFENRTIYWMR